MIWDLAALIRKWFSPALVANHVSGEKVVVIKQFEGTLNIGKAEKTVHAPHTLTPIFDKLIGREELLSTLESKVSTEGAKIICISGFGGVGKTSVALHLAHRLISAFGDLQLEVSLEGGRENPVPSVEIVSRMLNAWGVPVVLVTDAGTDAEKFRNLRDAYRSRLHGQKGIVLFDNVEMEAQVMGLLPPTSCVTIVTSRQALNIAGAYSVVLEPFGEQDSRMFLASRAPRLQEYAGEVSRICGGLPLALEVFVSFVQKRPSTDGRELIAEFEKNSDQKTGIQAVIREADRLIEEPVIAVKWYALCVFPSSFEGPQLSLIWIGVGQHEANRYLDELVQRVLLQYNPETKRFRMHDTVRRYCRGKLSETEYDDLQGWHAMEFATLLSGCEGPVLEFYQKEQENIRAAMRYALEKKRADPNSLGGSMLATAFGALGARLLDIALSPNERIGLLEEAAMNLGLFGDYAAQVRMLCQLARGLLESHADGKAREVIRRAIAMCREHQLTAEEAECHANMAMLHASSGEPEAVVEDLTAASKCSETANDIVGVVKWRCLVARQYLGLKREEEFKREFSKVTVIALEASDTRAVGELQFQMGEMHADQGRIEEAVERFRESISVLEKSGDIQGLVKVKESLAKTLLSSNRSAAATIYMDIAELYSKQHNPIGEGASLFKRAAILQSTGDLRVSLQVAKEAKEILSKVGSPQVADVEKLIDDIRMQSSERKKSNRGATHA